jgi:flagellar basal-body rod protein FlgG
MLRSLWIAKTGMDAQQTSLDTISNNLANVSTTAYKRVRPIFEDLLYQNIRSPGLNEDSGSYVPAGLQAGNGARIAATQRINSAGSLVQSQNPLDMAINGNGYFAVSTANGVAYTRAGNFMRNDKGQIVTASGNVLLGQSSVTSASASSPGIVIPSKATSVAIGSDGTVSYNLADSTAPSQADQIAMVNFVNPTGLAAAGGGLYYETMSSGEAQVGVAGKEGFGFISQYYTEQSNVNVAEELVSLIAAQRAYEITAKSVSASDQMLQKLGQL